MSSDVFAPAPDFRYVGLEPIQARRLRAAAAPAGLAAGVALAASGLDGRLALLAGAAVALASALSLQRPEPPASGGARMAIVPWGVLVELGDGPRILRWAAVRRVRVVTSRARSLAFAVSSRVEIETDRDRFVGAAHGSVSLDGLVRHLDAYAAEQSTPVALDLDGARPLLGADEPACEVLLAAACDYLETGAAASRLGLPPAGYRRASARSRTPGAVDALRRVLRDRTPRAADPRAFAAVLAAELRAEELAPELVMLTQSPHPVVAALAKQAARRLGVPRSRIGTLDEVAPFLTWPSDRITLEGWGRR